jgi:translation initiation factor 2 alpha subunit (eIF-2alpha)
VIAMLVRGKRGKEGIGCSIKDSNQNGTLYIVVWDNRTYDKDHVKSRREQRKKEGKEYRNYSEVKEWKSKGPVDDPASWERLREHLADIYGDEFDMLEIERELMEKCEKLRNNRNDKLKVLEKQIRNLVDALGIKYESLDIPNGIPQIKKLIKKLELQLEQKESE